MANFEASDTHKGAGTPGSKEPFYSISPEDQASYMKSKAADGSGNPLPATRAGDQSRGAEGGGGNPHHGAGGAGERMGGAAHDPQIERLTPSPDHKSSIELAPPRVESPMTVPHASLDKDAITFGDTRSNAGNAPVKVADSSDKGPVSPFPEGHTVHPDGTVTRGKGPVDPLDVWQTPRK